VVQYDVPVRSHHELPLRTGDERPGDVMIQHDMSTCILCTRCVRACEDIQEVGVLDVAMRANMLRSSWAAMETPTMPAVPGAANACESVPPAPSRVHSQTTFRE
jgi:predicted molibdopterin-dependent oxidoreductase YjgC